MLTNRQTKSQTDTTENNIIPAAWVIQIQGFGFELILVSIL